MTQDIRQWRLFFCQHRDLKRVSARLLLVIIILGVVAGGCGKKDIEDGETGEEAVRAVRVAPVERQALVRTLDYVGTVQPEREVEVVARMGATAVEVYADEGDEVERMTSLVRMESPDLEAQIDRLAAEADRMRREFEYLCGEYERERPLLEAGVVTEAKVAASKSRCETSEQGWRAARAALEEARQRRDYLEESSPLDGVVLHRAVENGEHVSPGRALFTVGSEELDVRVMVTESDLIGGIEVGTPVEIGREADFVTSRVTRIAPLAKGPGRTVEIRVELPEVMQRRLRAGMSVDAEFALERGEKTTTVPVDALVDGEEGAAVFAVDEGRAVKTPVEVGMRTDERAAIVSPLRKGQAVVVSRPERLRDGEAVYPVDAEKGHR